MGEHRGSALSASECVFRIGFVTAERKRRNQVAEIANLANRGVASPGGKYLNLCRVRTAGVNVYKVGSKEKKRLQSEVNNPDNQQEIRKNKVYYSNPTIC